MAQARSHWRAAQRPDESVPGGRHALRQWLRRDKSRINRTANYKVVLVSYADGEPFASTQRKLIATALAAGIDRSYAWNAASLKATAWGRTVLPELQKRYGRHARWAWKPYIILAALRRVEPGDFVLYVDASRHVRQGFSHAVRPLTDYLRRHSYATGEEVAASGEEGALAPPRHGFVPGTRLWKRNSNGIFWNGATP